MALQRFSAARVLTPDGWLSGAGLAVRDGLIEAVGASSELAQRFPDAQPVDLGGLVLLPGTVNAHNHSFQSLLRGRT